MTDGAHDHAALAPTALVLSETSARQQGDTALQAAIDALTARVTKLEAPVAPPVVTPITQLPPQVVSGPLNFTYDGQTIQNVIIDIAPGQPMTIGNQASVTPTSSVYGKGHSGCTLANVTMRGRNYGALLVDMTGFRATDCTVLEVDYCGWGIFGGANGSLVRVSAKKIGMLRTDFVSNAGEQNNAYGVKFEKASQAGGTSGVPATWLLDQYVVEDSPLWQGVNAHDANGLIVSNGVVRRCPRGIYLAGNIANAKIIGNQILEPVTKPGGTTDVTAISYGGWTNGTIDGNTIASAYPAHVSNIDRYLAAGTVSTGVVIGSNPVV